MKHQPASRQSAFYWSTGEPSIFLNAREQGNVAAQAAARATAERRRAEGDVLTTVFKDEASRKRASAFTLQKTGPKKAGKSLGRNGVKAETLEAKRKRMGLAGVHS